MSRLRHILICLLLVLAPAGALAQVQAQLVAAETSVRPGQPLVVALHLRHDTRWHTFWKNPGIGLPTSIQWRLPPGWSAGEIQWPVPMVVRDREGNITGHGYEGDVHLPVVLTPPAQLPVGETVTLKGVARWLMCDRICIPGHREVSLTLPVRDAPPQPDPAVRDALAAMSMPHDAGGWKVAASNPDGTVVLHVAAPGAINDVHFFPAGKFVEFRQSQVVASSGSKAVVRMGLDPVEVIPDGSGLEGVLAYRDAEGRYRGLDVRVPFVSRDEAVALVDTADIRQSAGGDDARGLSLGAGILLFAFLGGLILNLMPCVFPVLGIKIVGFAEQAGQERHKVSIHGLAFTAGVLLSFWALAAVLAVLRAGGEQLGWGFQLQSAPFVFVLTAVLLVFAMSLGGAFHFGLGATAMGGGLQRRQGLAGSFFTGVLATVVATPCSAPFLAPALGAALALPVAQSFVVFTFVALGLALPYLLLSFRPGLLRWLPRPGRWMETLKQGMAFLLYASAAFLLWVLAGQTSEQGFLYALLGLTCVCMAFWLYGRFGQGLPSPAPWRTAVALTLGGVLLVGGLYYGWPRPPSSQAVAWEPWSVERVAQLRSQGRGIYVDFTARWCATCQVNKRVVFSSARVRDYFRDNGIVALKADWTNSDPAITAELERWGRSAVPFNLAYPPGMPAEARAVVLPEVLTPDIVLGAFGTGAAPAE